MDQTYPLLEACTPEEMKVLILEKLLTLFQGVYYKKTTWGYYKCELCKDYISGNGCSFEAKSIQLGKIEKCHFAHGFAELHPRPYEEHHFKVRQCDCQGKHIHSDFLKHCEYKSRCVWRHDDLVYQISQDPYVKVYFSEEEQQYRICYKHDRKGSQMCVYSVSVPEIHDEQFEEFRPYLEQMKKIFPPADPCLQHKQEQRRQHNKAKAAKLKANDPVVSVMSVTQRVLEKSPSRHKRKTKEGEMIAQMQAMTMGTPTSLTNYSPMFHSWGSVPLQQAVYGQPQYAVLPQCSMAQSPPIYAAGSPSTQSPTPYAGYSLAYSPQPYNFDYGYYQDFGYTTAVPFSAVPVPYVASDPQQQQQDAVSPAHVVTEVKTPTRLSPVTSPLQQSCVTPTNFYRTPKPSTPLKQQNTFLQNQKMSTEEHLPAKKVLYFE